MTTTSNNPRLFQAGPFYVTIVTMQDKDFPGGERRMFAVIQEGHEVIAAIGPMLSGAMRAAFELDKDLQEAIKDPNPRGAANEPQGFPGGGFPRFQN